MKKQTRYYVIIAILIIFFLVLFFVYGKDDLVKEKDAATLIIGNDTVWNYSNQKWLKVGNAKNKEKLNWLDYEVYLDNKSIGKNYLWYDGEKWFIFDKNKKAVNKNGNIIAFRSNYDITIKDFNPKPISNFYHVNKVLRNNNISTSSKYTVADEVDIDIDNDGQNEKLYFISNAFSLEYNPDKIFSIVFMVKNNKIYQIYRSIDKNFGTNGCKPYLKAVLDVNRDNVDEIVISCGRYSVEKPIDMLYEFSDDKFQILITNH